MKGKDLRYTLKDSNSMAIPLYKSVNRSQRRRLNKEKTLIEDNFIKFDLNLEELIFKDEDSTYSELFEHYAKEFVNLVNSFTKVHNLKYHKVDKGYFIRTYQGE